MSFPQQRKKSFSPHSDDEEVLCVCALAKKKRWQSTAEKSSLLVGLKSGSEGEMIKITTTTTISPCVALCFTAGAVLCVSKLSSCNETHKKKLFHYLWIEINHERVVERKKWSIFIIIVKWEIRVKHPVCMNIEEHRV